MGVFLVFALFLSHYPYFVFSSSPVFDYYMIAAPVFLVLFPLSLGLFLKAKNTLNPLFAIGLLIIFALAFVFMVPVTSRSYYDGNCKSYATEWLSLGRLFIGAGFRAVRFLCL